MNQSIGSSVIQETNTSGMLLASCMLFRKILQNTYQSTSKAQFVFVRISVKN